MKLETYLTENNLYDVLCAWAGQDNVQRQAKVVGTKFRSDFEVVVNERIIVVEYDGDTHYRDANVIFRDEVKESICREGGKEIIKIPYFVQLTSQTFEHFFGEPFDVETDFPHGFITTKILPASFCPIGYNAAMDIYTGLPVSVKRDIQKSLDEKGKSLPSHCVWFRRSYDGMSWDEFLTKAHKAHGDKYEYIRDL